MCLPLRSRAGSRVARGERSDGGELGARGCSGKEDPVRVCAVLGTVRTDPGDHLLDVNKVVRPLRAGAQPVVRADADPAAAGQPVDERQALAVLPAHGEPSAVEVNQDGAEFTRRKFATAPVEVKQVRRACAAIPDVRDTPHVMPPHMQWPQKPGQFVPWRQSAGGEAAGAFAPARADAVVERLVDGRHGRTCAHHQYDQDRDSERRDDGDGPGDSSVQVAQHHGKQGGGA
jgi:hypothetical protein